MEDLRIIDYISEENIELNLNSKTKSDVIRELIDLIKDSKKIKNYSEALVAINSREELGSTGIGRGVAIPHAKTDAVSDLVIGFGISREGIDFKSMDEEKVKIFFLFLSPLDGNTTYLRILARISRLIREDSFRNSLLEAKSREDIIKILNTEEK